MPLSMNSSLGDCFIVTDDVVLLPRANQSWKISAQSSCCSTLCVRILLDLMLVVAFIFAQS